MSKKLMLFGVFLVVAVCGIFAFLVSQENIPQVQEKFFPDKYYKIEYAKEVNEASEEFGVPAELIFAIIKIESNFEADAVSSVGAKGLMQLMPDTFSWIAMRLGEKVTENGITDVTTNIRYGTYFLSFLLERFEDENAVYAAYNAGYNRVKGWLSDKRYSSDGKKLDYIPYDETSNYVEKVSRARENYKKIICEEKSE